eukprot:SAG11_NODE_19106_length_474_cov_0.789333_1_plen_157_part_11
MSHDLDVGDLGPDPFAKYTGGFEGSFATTAVFFGGLDELIGSPRKDVDSAVEDEHTAVPSGFGASDFELKTGNYQVVFTPRREYAFVADPDFTEPMDAGIDYESQQRLGKREKVDMKELLQSAVTRIRRTFEAMGWSQDGATQEIFDTLRFSMVELV